MIHVIATIELYRGRREAFLEEFRKLVPKVHAERGCLEYGPTIDVETDITSQAPNRENVVTIVEKWESLEALHEHLSAPHMTEYRQRVKELVKGIQIQVLRPV